MKIYKRLISSFTLSLFIFTCIPANAIASTIMPNMGKYVEPQFEDQQEKLKVKQEDLKIVKEIVEKREENVKHFLLQDNTYEAVVYKEPVHFKENGKWVDIDNSLIDSKDKNGEEILENKKNDFKVKVAKESKSKELINIKKNDYEISWGIENQVRLIEDENKDIIKPKNKQVSNKEKENDKKNLEDNENKSENKAQDEKVKLKQNSEKDKEDIDTLPKKEPL